MTFELLARDLVAQLEQREFTYPDVGRTIGAPPTGYHQFSRTRTLPGTRDFVSAASDLMSWQVQQRCGLQVAASSPVIEAGTVTIMRLGVGPVALRIPCRVVYVVDQPDRQGFAYGTLAGHPESGEEAFVLQRGRDGRTSFTVSAFSRPGSTLTKLAGPVARGFQLIMTRRYLVSLDT